MVRATAACLVEGAEDMAVTRKGVPVSVRVPEDLAKRLDRLVLKASKARTLGSLGLINKSSVVKLALLRGVEALEAELK